MRKYYYIIVVLFYGSIAMSQVSGSTEVGITEGQLSVSLSGAATYTIPISVPPGINGVVPQISLSYSSQAGNGMAGYGWNITGVSSITRIPSTQFHDGIIDPVDYDASDRFALDGQRLIVKNGTSGVYGANGTEYETENFSNLKITSIGVDLNGANFGPAYFKVEYPDGSHALYGYSTNSSTKNQYGISYWQNPQGLRISYFYDISLGSLYVVNISYGTRLTDDGINKIFFDYGTRYRPEQSFIGGLNVVLDRVLSGIRISGNQVMYRNYQLHREVTSLGYERLKAITEKTGDNSLSYNSTRFDYDTTDNENYFNLQSAVTLDLTNINFINTNSITGDFDGDSKLDFVLYPITGTNAYNRFHLFKDIGTSTTNNAIPAFPGGFKSIFASTWLTVNNKVSPRQGITIAKVWASNIIYETYAYGSNGLYLEYSKNIALPTFQRRNGCAPGATPGNCIQAYTPISANTSSLKNYSGDFNGDGITDVIAIINTSQEDINCAYCYNLAFGCTLETCYEQPATTYNANRAFFIDLKRDATTSFFEAGTIGTINATTKIEVADFNGDGKSDLYVINTGSVVVYTLDSNNQFSVTWYLYDTGIKTDRPILFGDFNGDSKIDFCIPQTVSQDSWNFYFANGINFTILNTTIGLKYLLPRIEFFGVNPDYTAKSLREVSYIATDITGDGKSDIVYHENYTIDSYSDSPQGTPQVTLFWVLENKLATSTSVLFNKIYVPAQYAAIGPHPIPIFTNHNGVNENLEYALMSNNKVRTFKSVKDNKTDVLLKKITSGNDVIEFINYKPLKNEVCGFNCNSVYTDSGNTEIYPNTDIVLAPSYKVVTSISKLSNSVYKKQEFMYYGAVTNFQGLGFLGFRATMRTNWSENGINLISNISKNDITLRGANNISYSVLGFELPQNLTPTSNFISKTINTFNIDNTTGSYQDPLQANKVFNLKITKNEQINGLEGTSSITTTDFDSLNNPTQSITHLKNGGAIEQTTTSTIGYVPITTAPIYVLGRPASKITETKVFPSGDISSTEELYGYDNHLLTQVQKRATNSVQTSHFITENNIFDVWGNITKKTLTYPGLASRFTDYEYDTTTHRFLTKSYDIEHLATEFTYDLSSGVLLTEKLPCTTGNLITTYEYDKWFRRTKIINYLNNESIISYQRLAEKTLITTTGQDDSVSTELFDDLGRKIRTGIKNINGVFSYIDYVYDIHDRSYKISEPYLSSDSASQWNETTYDAYGRVTQAKSFTDKIVTYAYSGLTTTMIENTTSGNPPTATTKTKVSVKDAIGNLISNTESTSSGAVGTITYKYFANRNLKSTTFDGNVTSIEQDCWGRKKLLDDTSAGLYQYTYNGFGETLTEVTPNGTTTYLLNDFGKVTVKTISNGSLTNSTATNIYDPNTKLLIATNFIDYDSNPAQPATTNYVYEYDDYNRLKKTIENAPQARFERETTFDDFGRSLTKNYKAQNKSDGKFSEIKVKNTYLKGFHWQVLEHGTDNVLWQTDLVNARGQLVTAQYGTLDGGTSILGVVNHEYDDFGLPSLTSFTTQNGSNASATPFMTLSTTFSEQRGNLLTRNYSFYGTDENFYYDDLDRLTVTPAPAGAPAGTRSGSTQTYDNKGRILYNDLGEYKYDSQKPYRSTGLKITDPAVTAYYNTRTPQVITYNAIKRPVTIDELNLEKITFEYNDNNNRSVMYYGDYQADKNVRKFRKFYSADGVMEIKRNIVDGTVEFLTYIGGDGYTAPVVMKSDGTNQNYLYLHRDYQGSIIAISDGTGQLVEQRHFDAWGTILKYAKGSTTSIPTSAGLMLLDRGYTGHEHLLGVGIINMNGRLYDPKLHRFLSPDNYVQDTSNTQSFNRYGYCWNNPLAHTDPSGEFMHIVIGAILGGVINWAIHGMQFNAQGLGYFGVGALAGGLAAMGAGGVSSVLANGSFAAGALGTAAACSVGSGFLSGAVVGAAAGFVGGFVSGIGNSLIDGKNIGDSFKYGIRDAAIGAITGGAIGGVAGGVDASMDGRDFWTGAGEHIDYVTVPANSVSTAQEYGSNAEMRADYNNNIGRRDGISLSQVESKLNTSVSLGNDSNLPNGWKVGADGLLTSGGDSAGGITYSRYSGGVSNRVVGSQIKIAPALKGYNLNMRNMIFKHEFMHAWHMNSGFAGYETYTERATSTYSYAYCNAYGESMANTYWRGTGYYPPQYSWRNFNKIIPLWIK